MVTRIRLEKRAELKARKLTRRTFRALCVCTAMFLSAIVGGAVVMNLYGAPSKGGLPASLLMFLGQGHVLIPIKPIQTAPKE